MIDPYLRAPTRPRGLRCAHQGDRARHNFGYPGLISAQLCLTERSRPLSSHNSNQLLRAGAAATHPARTSVARGTWPLVALTAVYRNRSGRHVVSPVGASARWGTSNARTPPFAHGGGWWLSDTRRCHRRLHPARNTQPHVPPRRAQPSLPAPASRRMRGSARMSSLRPTPIWHPRPGRLKPALRTDAL